MDQTQISYEQLAAEYNRLAQENQQLSYTVQQLQFDKTNEQIKLLTEILTKGLSKKVTKLAEWNLCKILQKPKKKK